MAFVVPVLIALLVGAALLLARRRGTAPPAGEEASPNLTLLLREPRVLTTEHLVAAARGAFGRDLSGGGDDATEFAEAAGTQGIVQLEGWNFPVVSAPEPMVENPEAAAEAITELRRKIAFAEHRAFISVGCHRPPEASREEAYARMGRLVAELVDDTALLLYSDDTRTGALLNEETMEALRGGDPLRPLRTVNDTSIGLVSGEDPRMVAATAEARRRLPEFVAAVRAGVEHGIVKGPFTDGTHTEFMWVEARSVAGESIRGALMNAPFQVRGLRQGATVEVRFEAVSDWAYPASDGTVGPFTEGIVRGAL